MKCTHSCWDPVNSCYRIGFMKKRIVHLLRSTFNSINNPNNQKILIISGFALLFTCLPFLLAVKPMDRNIIAKTSTYPSPTIILTSTKWWIKATPSSTTAHPSTAITFDSAGIPGGDCSSDVSSNLRPGVYAYISLNPPLPNRVRSGAGIIYSYIGELEPSAGVKVIDGPLCADGYSWWLIESTNAPLKGWTVMGSGSKQWIIPCANPNIPCDKAPVNPPTVTLTVQDNDHNQCKSDMFVIGMVAQVKQGDLLVIRSEPYTGAVIGYAGPMSTVNIMNGPHCAGGTTWWKVRISESNLTGWTTEVNLTTCSKEDGCL